MEGSLEAFDDAVLVVFVDLEIVLMVLENGFLFCKLLVSLDSVVIYVVDEVRPPVQRESLVGVLDDLGLIGQRRELHVSAQHLVDGSEGVQAELTDAAFYDFALPNVRGEADNFAEAQDDFRARHDCLH